MSSSPLGEYVYASLIPVHQLLNCLILWCVTCDYSGTEKQHVANDYAKRLHMGQVECETVISDIAGEFMAGKSGGAQPSLKYCEYLNISVCPSSESVSSVSYRSSISHNMCKRTSLFLYYRILYVYNLALSIVNASLNPN